MTDFFVRADEQLNYSFMTDEKAGNALHLRFYLERNAQVVVEVLFAHITGELTIEAFLIGEGATISINGAYVLDGTDRLHLRTLQHHQAAHTKSNLVMRGVLNGISYAAYNGMIRVDKAARASVSSQENKNILLSAGARALSVPSLEVLTNDVRCLHASAIGRFDQDQLFYAASRGITEKKAQQLLLQAFFATLFKNQLLQNRLKQLVHHE